MSPDLLQPDSNLVGFFLSTWTVSPPNSQSNISRIFSFRAFPITDPENFFNSTLPPAAGHCHPYTIWLYMKIDLWNFTRIFAFSRGRYTSSWRQRHLSGLSYWMTEILNARIRIDDWKYWMFVLFSFSACAYFLFPNGRFPAESNETWMLVAFPSCFRTR
jgi:hypothetical protein